MQLTDSHCHLDFAEFSDPAALWQQCRQQGIERLIIPATEPGNWASIAKLATGLEGVYWAAGLHPWWAEQYQLDPAQLQRALSEPNCIALGECGLDGGRPQSEQHLQALATQIEVAKSQQLPLILHGHKAHNGLLELLRHYRPAGGVIHAFSGSLELAQQYIKLGFAIGIGAAISYERAKKTRNTAATLPLESIVLETDAPAMPLAGAQGKPNSPLALLQVAQILAELRGESIDTIASVTSANCDAIFNFPAPT
ncbi:MAG: TatD family hydrolase [Cellvibrionaceae bacterium]|nr:TatD family hydrolase [Cellvibrionaceae bacterium]